MKQLAAIAGACLLAVATYADWRGDFDDAFFAQRAAGGGETPLNIPNLIAHWKMNDSAANTNVLDTTGNYNQGAYSNTAVISVAGKINGALTFHGNAGVEAGTVFSDWQIPLFIHAGYLNAGGRGLTGGTLLQSNTWYHLAITYTNPDNILTFFVNGIEDGNGQDNFGSTSWSISAWVRSISNPATYTYAVVVSLWSTATFGIGKDSNNPGIVGDIDDVRIYNRALSMNELSQIYNGGAGTEAE